MRAELPHTILLVEDEPGIADMLVLALELDGLRVVATANGIEALETLKQTDVDLLLTDVMMPMMDGIELCGAVRAHPDYAQLPILVHTSVEERQLRQAFDDYDGYLQKPVSIDELTQTVRRLLGVPHAARDRAEAPPEPARPLSDAVLKFLSDARPPKKA